MEFEFMRQLNKKNNYNLSSDDLALIFRSLNPNYGSDRVVFNKGLSYENLPKSLRDYLSSINESNIRYSNNHTSTSTVDLYNKTKDSIKGSYTEDDLIGVFYKIIDMPKESHSSRLSKLTLFSGSVLDRLDMVGIEDDVTNEQMLSFMCLLKKIDELCEYESRVAEIKEYLSKCVKSDIDTYGSRYYNFPTKKLEEYSKVVIFLEGKLQDKQKDQEIDQMLKFIEGFSSPYLDPIKSEHFHPKREYSIKEVLAKLEKYNSENKERVGLGNNLESVFNSGSEKGKDPKQGQFQ